MENHVQRLLAIWGDDQGDSSRALAWIQSTITRLHEEDVYLDFKQKKDKSRSALDDDDKKNLAKSISGFANTDGGLVIWGVKAKADPETDDPDVAVELMPIKNLKAFQTNLNSASGGLVGPPVPGVENRAVPDSQNGDTGYVITVVPKRRNTLTQATAKTGKGFYIRSGSGFHQLPEPLIAEFYRRKPSPLLRLYLEFAEPRECKFCEKVKKAEHGTGDRGWGHCEFEQGLSIGWNAILKNDGLGSATEVVVQLSLSRLPDWLVPAEWSLTNFGAKRETQSLYQPYPVSRFDVQTTLSGTGRVLEAIHPGQVICVASGILRISSATFSGIIDSFEINGSAYAMDSPPFELSARYEGTELHARYSDVFHAELQKAPASTRTVRDPNKREIIIDE